MSLDWRKSASGLVRLLFQAALVSAGIPSIAAQEPDTTVLDPIVVTATRLETPRASVVASVSVVTGEDLRARGVGTVAQALRLVAGLTVAETGSFGSTTSLFMRGGESDYVKVLIDGVSVNDPGGGYDFADLALVNVDRIEIVRGPTSVLYGTDAIAGVIQVFTRRARGKPRLEASAARGTYASLRVDASAVGGTERLNFGVGLLRSSTDGTYEYNSAYDNLVLTGSASADIDDRSSVVVTARYGSSEFHFPTDGSGNVVDRNAFQLRDQISGSLHMSRFISRAIEGRAVLSMSRSVRGIDDQPDDSADTLGFFEYTSDGTVTRTSADVGANFHLSSRAVLSSGVQVERQSERSASESSSQFGASHDSLHVSRSTRGYYMQLQLQPEWKGALNGGLRLDDSDNFGTFLTYRIGATLRVGQGGLLRGSLGRGFKEPSFFENFAESPFAVGNPALKPERSTTWELGVEQEARVLGSVVSVTYFDQRFADLIQFDAAPAALGEPNYINVAAARSSGLELEVRAEVSTGLHLSASYTHLHTEVTDAGLETDTEAAFVEGEPLLRRAKHKAGANVSYDWDGIGVVNLDLDYIGSRVDRDFSGYPTRRVELPAYVKLDLSGVVALWRRRDGSPWVSVTARIDNLLNREYEEIVGFPARKRVIFLGGRLGS